MKREILWYPGPHLENSGSISYWSKRVPSMKKNAPQVLPLLIQTHSNQEFSIKIKPCVTLKWEAGSKSQMLFLFRLGPYADW